MNLLGHSFTVLVIFDIIMRNLSDGAIHIVS